MGHTEFLVGSNAPTPSNLPDSIADLEDASNIFMNRWKQRDLDRAGSVSRKAMEHLDFIVNELLREKVERKGHGTYISSPFETQMEDLCGNGVTGVTLIDQQTMVKAGAGAGAIASHLGTPNALSLDRLLNKIKHRNRSLVNFRIENDKHIFVICPEHTQGGAEGIYEFDVLKFCAQCRLAAAAL